MESSVIRQFVRLFRRISLDDVDIIAEGETPKSKHYVLLDDVPDLISAIKTMDEQEAIRYIASKLHKAEEE